MQIKLVNLTPHSVKLVDAMSQAECVVREHRRLKPIRVIQSSRLLDQITYNGLDIPLKLILPNRASEDAFLPPQEDGVIYIVSRVVADCYKNLRPDFVFPYDFQRAEEGKIIGCQSLATFHTTQH